MELKYKKRKIKICRWYSSFGKKGEDTENTLNGMNNQTPVHQNIVNEKIWQQLNGCHN